MLRRFNHVAFRCNDARETVDFYTKALGLTFAHAVSNDVVPSVQQYCPHIHIFFELGDGSYIAFFEVPTVPEAIPDTNTPSWVQHVSFDVADDSALHEGKRLLENYGVEVLGPVDHEFAHSIYFFDPNGHRLELTHWLENESSDRARYRAEAGPLLEQWEERKAKGLISSQSAAG
ncbi:VOC family protein [Sphingosinicella rhizophila]|uniref:VOC family protein n=1 Tax=Sphingosinicella rhizophila TaxID=3050082 RepID=A0ABU3QAV8_9SPHN|nr:VOC family protein [Sphingosinicella sp. GR2756]MDT9600546.1 VOC family protein [Sphingosinicella sp. GR2756]